jgi:uncharacterized membrane protein (UPF0136 family)
MNFAHVHIVLNHIPSIGTVIGVALFIVSMMQRNDRLMKLSLQILVVMALAVLPTYVSGNAAQRLIRSRKDIPQGLVEVHQNAAMITLALMTITGTLAWFGLWQFRRYSRPGFGNSSAVLVFSLLTAAAIFRTGNLGGDISHPEIRLEAEAAPETVGWRAPVERFSNQQSWVWPASETIHFIGMPMLFGVVLLLTLRMLGMMKSIPYAALHRLLPLGVLGFVLNVISGMLFFISSPGMYVTNSGFVLKVLFIVLAGIGMLYFTMFEEPWSVGPDKEAPLKVKVLAVCTLSFLLGVMYFGRMLPFLRH